MCVLLFVVVIVLFFVNIGNKKRARIFNTFGLWKKITKYLLMSGIHRNRISQVFKWRHVEHTDLTLLYYYSSSISSYFLMFYLSLLFFGGGGGLGRGASVFTRQRVHKGEGFTLEFELESDTCSSLVTVACAAFCLKDASEQQLEWLPPCLV